MKKLFLTLIIVLVLSLGFGLIACDDAEPHTHTYETEWTKDATCHYKKANCEHTDEVSEKAEHVYGNDNICDVCAYERHIHTYETEWTKDATYHYKKANCEHTDEVSEKAEHAFGDDNVCDVCAYERHIHTYETEWTKDATYHYKKANCEHANLVREKTEHTFGDDNVCDICEYMMSAEALLNGKYVSILGDSISTFEGISNSTTNNLYLLKDGAEYSATKEGITNIDDTYWGQIIKKYNMNLLVNNSVCGSALVGSESTLLSCGTTRIDNLGANNGTLNGIKPDIIFIYMGTNDLRLDKVPGALNNNIYANVHNGNGYITPTTFAEAYVIAMEKATALYPNANIYCFTILPGAPEKDEAYQQYNEIIKGIATHYEKAYLVDIAKDSGIGYDNINDYTKDGCHPNVEGARKIAEVLDNALIDSFTNVVYKKVEIVEYTVTYMFESTVIFRESKFGEVGRTISAKNTCQKDGVVYAVNTSTLPELTLASSEYNVNCTKNFEISKLGFDDGHFHDSNTSALNTNDTWATHNYYLNVKAGDKILVTDSLKIKNGWWMVHKRNADDTLVQQCLFGNVYYWTFTEDCSIIISFKKGDGLTAEQAVAGFYFEITGDNSHLANEPVDYVIKYVFDSEELGSENVTGKAGETISPKKAYQKNGVVYTVDTSNLPTIDSRGTYFVNCTKSFEIDKLGFIDGKIHTWDTGVFSDNSNWATHLRHFNVKAGDKIDGSNGAIQSLMIHEIDTQTHSIIPKSIYSAGGKSYTFTKDCSVIISIKKGTGLSVQQSFKDLVFQITGDNSHLANILDPVDPVGPVDPVEPTIVDYTIKYVFDSVELGTENKSGEVDATISPSKAYQKDGVVYTVDTTNLPKIIEGTNEYTVNCTKNFEISSLDFDDGHFHADVTGALNENNTWATHNNYINVKAGDKITIIDSSKIKNSWWMAHKRNADNTLVGQCLVGNVQTWTFEEDCSIIISFKKGDGLTAEQAIAGFYFEITGDNSHLVGTI